VSIAYVPLTADTSECDVPTWATCVYFTGGLDNETVVACAQRRRYGERGIGAWIVTAYEADMTGHQLGGTNWPWSRVRNWRRKNGLPGGAQMAVGEGAQ
jgi:hypothetical protein